MFQPKPVSQYGPYGAQIHPNQYIPPVSSKPIDLTKPFHKNQDPSHFSPEPAQVGQGSHLNFSSQQPQSLISAKGSFVGPSGLAGLSWNNNGHYDAFESSSSPLKTSSHFSDSRHFTNPDFKCPLCLTNKEYFKLESDVTNTVFCGHCRQPFHHCPIHRKAINGMGHRNDDPMAKRCQCNHGQSFLGNDHWESCFNE